MSTEGNHGFLECTEFGGNLRSDIEVSGLQEDQVGIGVEGAESTGAIFDHADDAVEAFGDGVGEVVSRRKRFSAIQEFSTERSYL